MEIWLLNSRHLTNARSKQGGTRAIVSCKNRTGKTSTVVLAIIGSFAAISFVCCGGCVFFFTNIAPVFAARQVEAKYGDHQAFSEQIGEIKSASVSFVRQDEDRESYKTDVEVLNIRGSKGDGQLIFKKSGDAYELCVLRTDVGEYVLEDNRLDNETSD